MRRAGIDLIHAEEGSRNAFYALLLSRLARVPYLVLNGIDASRLDPARVAGDPRRSDRMPSASPRNCNA
ncbi:MAG: hypothetical protein ACXVR1_13710 [Solirubrobacteraceae bacterium]